MQAGVDGGFEVDEGAVDVEGEDFVAGERAGWVRGRGHGERGRHFVDGMMCEEWDLGCSQEINRRF